MKKKGVLSVLILLILIIPLISAGFFQNIKKTITGDASTTGTFQMNVSVASGAPTIYNMIIVPSSITLTDGPSPTFIIINFSVNDSDGAVNLQNTSAAINLSKLGETTRFNTSCGIINYGGYHANFSCNITVWWFDGDGQWVVSANISDINSNIVSNTTKNITLNTLTGFVMNSALNFSVLTPGTYNQTPLNFLTLNNTGNQPIVSPNIEINASDLRGEGDSSKALYAANFSVSQYTGGKIECNIPESATSLTNMTYTGAIGVALPDGNYTINDGSTGQERMYFCLREVGAELSQQYYSTNNLGAWTVKIA